MLKYLIIFICLISSSLFIYLPISEKNVDYYSDMCYYKENSDLIYVNACEKGQYCNKKQITNPNDYGICLNYTHNLINELGKSCKTDFECDEDLVCEGEICIVKSSGFYTKISNDENYYFCQSGFIPVDHNFSTYSHPLVNVPSYKCEAINNNDQNCFDSQKQIRVFPKYFKVCGLIDLDSSNEVKTVGMSNIGSVEINNFVEDEKACKTGFALYFYGDKSLNKANSGQNMYKLCVEFKGVKRLINGCSIKYVKDDIEYVYNTYALKDLSQFSPPGNKVLEDLNDKCEFLEIKLQFFKKYLDKMTDEKRQKCEEGDKFYSEPFTCGDDELREIWYYYNHPENYVLYSKQGNVINFLIQEEYPSYGNIKPTESTANSNFLNIKYFISLLILLSF